MTVIRRRWLFICVACLGSGLGLGPALAAQPPEVAAIRVAGEMQAVLYRSVAEMVAGVVTGEKIVRRLPPADQGRWEKLKAELAGILDLGKPGTETKIKYLEKLQARWKEVEDKSRYFVGAFERMRKVDLSDGDALAKASRQAGYALNELIRHLAQGADLAGSSQKERHLFVEVVILVRMEADLRTTCLEAFLENSHWCRPNPDLFWEGLGRFDVSAALYRGLVDLGTPLNQPRAKAFARLLELKKDILGFGETMYHSSRELGDPDLKAAQGLKRAFDDLTPVFRAIKAETEK